MTSFKSCIPNKVLSPEQIHALDLPIGIKVSIEITNPHLRADLGIEKGYLTITDSGYTFNFDSEGEEIIDAYEYLQQRFNEGCWVRFSLTSDKPIWYIWQSKPWCYGKPREGVKTLFIGSPNS
ncbi:hypothetical protein C7B77_07275 [Chamaesiphon polymorphus CCALA 037]|uniref:Uncharacterized protein n=1 Tax=Chamaesiphon polymorphus CCALA 037 TaxID=2107692 RepID=A0A2T1GIY7_9CYAN|nr:hypothetical protein C7B77_07275 [Chamaesiphon polymorphus CCALA 037]